MKRFSKFTSAVATATMIASLLGPAAFAADPGPTVPDNSKTPKNFFALGYSAKWISQTQAGTSDQYFKVKPGDLVTVIAKFQNTGTKSWIPNNADRQVCIATYKDPAVKSAPSFTGYDDPTSVHFGKSYFRTNTWASEYRIGCVQESEVVPGAQGTFKLPFKVPTTAPSGKYREDISVASGPYWMANPINGDPLGVAHIWVGFNVQGSASGEAESLLNIYPFDTTLVPQQNTALVITAEDKSGDPIEAYDFNDLYLEIKDGSGSFYDATGTNENIVEVDSNLLPGVYIAGYRAGTVAETVTLRVTNMSVIPQASTQLTIDVTDKNISLSVFPEKLTAGVDSGGTYPGDEALLTVKMLDSNGNPDTGRAADLTASANGDCTVAAFNPLLGEGNKIGPADPFIEANANNSGIYLAKVRAGITPGNCKVTVHDLVAGTRETITVEIGARQIEATIFPPELYSNRAGNWGYSTILITVSDANGRPMLNTDISTSLQVTALQNVQGASLTCGTVAGNPYPLDLNGAGRYVYACDYTAPGEVKYNKTVPIKVRDTVTGASITENLYLRVGNNQQVNVARSQELELFANKTNVGEENGTVLFSFLKDVRGNPVGDADANYDAMGPNWSDMNEIDGGEGYPFNPTGIYYSILDTAYNKADDAEEVDVNYEDAANDVDFEDTVTVAVEDWTVNSVTFPTSISQGGQTTIITTISNAFGGAAAGFFFAENAGGNGSILYDPDNGVVTDASITNHANMANYAAFFEIFTSNEEDDGEVEINLEGIYELDDDVELTIPVGADDSMELVAFPSTVAVGYNSTIIMKLKGERGEVIDIQATAAPDRDNVLDLNSEDDDYSFDQDNNGDLLDQLYKISLDTSAAPQVYAGQGGAWDNAGAARGTGFYLLPYRAPLDNGTFTDSVEVEYDGGSEKITETVDIKVQD